jgi:hypothetical protein
MISSDQGKRALDHPACGEKSDQIDVSPVWLGCSRLLGISGFLYILAVSVEGRMA